MPISVNTTNNGVSSVTQGEVTWNFQSPVNARQTVDGAWVVEGPVVISSVTPALSGTGASLRNGLMVNPLYQADPNHDGQAWDGRDTGSFNESLEASSFPLTLQPDDVAVKAISQLVLEGAGDDDRQGWTSDSAALYIVDDLSSLPAGDFFSPSPIGWTGRNGFDFYESRVASAVASLPAYDTSNHANKISFATAEANVNIFSAMAGYSQFITSGSSSGYQGWLTYNGGGSRYGQFVMSEQEGAALGMIGNEFSNSEKETLLVALASMGIHLIQLGVGANTDGSADYFYNSFPTGLGGHHQWAQIPMDCAILASADTPTANLFKVSPSNMLLQAFEFTSDLVARLTPHDSNNEPQDYRRREVQGTPDTTSTPNTISLLMNLGGEDFRITTSSLKRVVSTDGLASSLMSDPRNTSLVTDPNNPDPINIPLDDATGFAGKTVYFEPVTPYQVGEYAWLKTNWRNRFSQFDSDLVTDYSATNNRWAGWTLFALASGAWDAQRTPAIRWTEGRASGVRDQTPPFETNWSEEFWTDYASTIFATSIDA